MSRAVHYVTIALVFAFLFWAVVLDSRHAMGVCLQKFSAGTCQHTLHR